MYMSRGLGDATTIATTAPSTSQVIDQAVFGTSAGSTLLWVLVAGFVGYFFFAGGFVGLSEWVDEEGRSV